MANKQINELSTRSDTPTASNILHTQDSGNIDVIMTVQDILDLVEDPTSAPSELVGSLDTTNDGLVMVDASDSYTQKYIELPDFVTALGVLAITGDESQTSGGQDMSTGFQIRWGTGTSTTDSAEGFTFSTPFSNACHHVSINRTAASGGKSLHATSKSASGFTIDRDQGIDGSEPFTYFAIGY